MRGMKKQDQLNGWQAWELGAKYYLILFGVATMVVTVLMVIVDPDNYWPHGAIGGFLFGTLAIVLGIISKVPGISNGEKRA